MREVRVNGRILATVCQQLHVVISYYLRLRRRVTFDHAGEYTAGFCIQLVRTHTYTRGHIII